MQVDLLLKEFGATDEAALFASKQSGKQLRVLNGGIKPPEPVDMTAEACKKALEKIGKEYLPGYEGRLLRYITTTEATDRYGDKVRASGALLDNYRKNPVICFAHEHHTFPVGCALTVAIDKTAKNIPAVALLLDDRVDSSGRSDLVYKFCKSRMMPACSIGFLPVESNRPKTPEERAKLGVGEYGVEYTKWDFLEFSPCSIPANPEALQAALKAFDIATIFNRGDIQRMNALNFITPNLLDMFDQYLIKNVGVPRIIVPCDGTHCCAACSPEEKASEYEALKDNESADIILRPYPNEHACRLVSPKDFSEFRRGSRKHEGKIYDVIFGKKKDSEEWAEQAYRYPIAAWTEDEARAHCDAHKGISFEPSSGKALKEDPMEPMEPEDDEKKPTVNITINVNAVEIANAVSSALKGVDETVEELNKSIIETVSLLNSTAEKIAAKSTAVPSPLPSAGGDGKTVSSIYKEVFGGDVTIDKA